MSNRLFIYAFCAMGLFASAPLWAAGADSPKAGLGAEPAMGAGYLLQLAVGLAIVLGAVFVLAWIVKRMNSIQAPAGGAMRVLGGIAVGQRERVVLIQVGDTQLLVGVAPGSVQRIHELETPLDMNARGGFAGEGFAAKLAAALRDRKGSGS